MRRYFEYMMDFYKRILSLKMLKFYGSVIVLIALICGPSALCLSMDGNLWPMLGYAITLPTAGYFIEFIASEP